MSQLTARSFAMPAVARAAGLALIAGMAGGVLFGIGARLGMRGVALMLRRLPELTAEGSLLFVLAAVFFLTPLALLYPALRPSLRGGVLARGLVFGAGSMALLGMPFFNGTDTTQVVIWRGLLPHALALFAPSFLGYGLAVAGVYEWAERRGLLAPSGPRYGWALLAAPVALELAMLTLMALQSAGLVPTL